MTIDWNKPLETITGKKVVIVHKGKRHNITDRNYYILVAYYDDDGAEQPLIVNEQGSVISDNLKQPFIRNTRIPINWRASLIHVSSGEVAYFIQCVGKTFFCDIGYLSIVKNIHGEVTLTGLTNSLGFNSKGDHIIRNASSKKARDWSSPVQVD